MNPIAGVGLAGTAGTPGAAAMVGMIGGPGKASDGAPFSELLNQAIGDVSRLEDEAQTAVQGLMTGSGVDVHQAMIATQKASMAFELSLAVRNKAIQAYQQLMGMQF
jgi:flagellar hook-basal body complex protein FliE